MSKWLALAAFIPLACDRLDRSIEWLRRRYQITIEEGDVYPSFRIICWLRVIHRNPGYDHDALIIKLPSYEWGSHYSRDRCGWLQRILIWIGPFQRREWQARKGWSMCLLEVQ